MYIHMYVCMYVSIFMSIHEKTLYAICHLYMHVCISPFHLFPKLLLLLLRSGESKAFLSWIPSLDPRRTEEIRRDSPQVLIFSPIVRYLYTFSVQHQFLSASSMSGIMIQFLSASLPFIFSFLVVEAVFSFCFFHLRFSLITCMLRFRAKAHY